MRNFKLEDFETGNVYLVALCSDQLRQMSESKIPTVEDDTKLSKTMYKLGFMVHYNQMTNTYYDVSCLINMNNGYTRYFNYENTRDTTKPNEEIKWTKIIWSDSVVGETGVEKVIRYLNNPVESSEYRFATKEEVLRVIKHAYEL